MASYAPQIRPELLWSAFEARREAAGGAPPIRSHGPSSPEHGYRERRKPEKPFRSNRTDNWKQSDSDCGQFKSYLARGLLEHFRTGKDGRVFEVRLGLESYKPSPGTPFETAPGVKFAF